MGLKRRGNARKKVLNLKEDVSSSKLGTWSQAQFSSNLPDSKDDTDDSHAKQLLNPLSGLLQHYNSNSEESEDEDTQEGTLELIKETSKTGETSKNQAPITSLEVQGHTSTQSNCVWMECFDETLGHPYYWNTITNTVVWEKPLEYSSYAEDHTKTPHAEIVTSKNVVNKSASVPKLLEKVFPVANERRNAETPANSSTPTTTTMPKLTMTPSDNTSVPCPEVYDPETETALSPALSPPKQQLAPVVNEEEPKPSLKLHREVVKSTDNTSSVAAALVANYGPDDSDEETDQPEIKQEKNEVMIRTIFPITSHPTPSLFLGSEGEKESNDLKRKYSSILLEESEQQKELLMLSLESNDSTELPSNSKQFKRKRRINVSAVRTQPQPLKSSVVEPDSRILQCDLPNNEAESKPRTGFGFPKQSDEIAPVNKQPSSGIQFIKATDSINLTEKVTESTVQTSVFTGRDVNKVETLENEAQLIIDKLSFLLEGESKSLSTVMALHLQTETLVLAWRAGALTYNYLEQRLQEASCQLSKQEMGAAPAGWLCCWDRYELRYAFIPRLQNVELKLFPQPIQ